MYSAIAFSQAYTWEGLGTGLNNGTNGDIYAVTSFNGKIIVGGLFTLAGGSVVVSNIAQYDPANDTWSALGSGTNGEVRSLAVYNSELVAGGAFTQAGGNNILNIARWNGSAWLGLNTGVDGECSALMVFNGELVAGGEMSNAGGVPVNNIAKWNGSVWSALGSGATGGSGNRVSALTVYNSNLIVAGRFTNAGGQSSQHIAGWTGAAWFPMSNITNERLFAVGVHNGQLYAGGRFTSIGGISARYIARWNGSSWFDVGGGLEDEVEAIASYKGELVVAGNFDFAGSGTNKIFVDNIAKFNGTNWQSMLTGMNDRVNALHVFEGSDTTLFAAGEFTSAGGKWCYHTAKWGLFNTSSISGKVQYADNNDSVMTGTVKVVRMDVNSRQIITIDSARIINGNYTIPRVPKRDSTLRVIVFPDDELDGGLDTFFVPTYYPSAIDWPGASVLYANNNLTNIDIRVIRRTAPPQNESGTGIISGKIYLNVLPPNNLPGNVFPFLAGTVIYLKRDTSFVKYSVSNDSQRYSIPGLSQGTYNVRVVRLGYEIKDTNVILGAQNIDSVNFHLDSLNVISAIAINNFVPKNFELRQNYPNPFNPVTKIRFLIKTATFAELKVFSVLGQEVASLLKEDLRPGEYEATFNAVNFPSGVYFYRLRTEDFSETKKMVLIK